MYKTLTTTLNDGILEVAVNRPDKMNALNQDVMKDLGLVIDEIYKRDDVYSAIITGTGPKAFIAGADIAEFLTLSPNQGMELAKRGQVIFQRIEVSPKPIAAAVNGFALGGGCELAMACHIRIASDNAKFGQPEVNLGIIPGYGGTQRLVQLVGKGKALELMMTADMIGAEEARQLGLVNHVTTPAELMDKTRSILRKIHAKAPLAIAKVVKCVNDYFKEDVDGFETEMQEFAKCFATSDLHEGAAAFVEKRPANFKGE